MEKKSLLKMGYWLDPGLVILSKHPIVAKHSLIFGSVGVQITDRFM